MGQTKLELYNVAATHLGARAKFTSLTQKHRMIEVFNTYFDIVRKQALAAAWWPDVVTVEPLVRISERTGAAWNYGDPDPGSQYLFTLPDNMLIPRHFASYGEFTMLNHSGEKLISAHEPRPLLYFTLDEANPENWSFDLYQCVAMALAAQSAQSVVGVAAVSQNLELRANELISRYAPMDANFNNIPRATASAWHAARGYECSPSPARYFHPVGPAFAIGTSANVS